MMAHPQDCAVSTRPPSRRFQRPRVVAAPAEIAGTASRVEGGFRVLRGGWLGWPSARRAVREIGAHAAIADARLQPA
ncbi:hypothetical protein, partial [Pseudoroseomonas ludipueritiae]|uniref:hypothetical protein n=1 Tax=Pseudoroseomonas ludipueritiae TaxID=198093 RepID=UPI001EEEB829